MFLISIEEYLSEWKPVFTNIYDLIRNNIMGVELLNGKELYTPVYKKAWKETKNAPMETTSFCTGTLCIL